MTAGRNMQGKNASRNDRLKAALRENLKRRKVQARARQEDGQDDAPREPDIRQDGPTELPPRDEA